MTQSESLKYLKNYYEFGCSGNNCSSLPIGHKFVYPVHCDKYEIDALRESFTPFKIKISVDYKTIFDIFEDFVSMFCKIKRFGDSHLEIIEIYDKIPEDKEWYALEEKYRSAFEKE